MRSKKISTILPLMLLAVALFAIAGCEAKKDYTDFAKCITKNGTVIYGAFWCPHCNYMKNQFGQAAQYLNYVECDKKGPSPNPVLCEQKKIESYPSIEFNDGQMLYGEVSFDLISQKTGCLLPK